MLERSRAQNVHCDGQQLIVLITDGAPDDSEADDDSGVDELPTDETVVIAPVDMRPPPS